MGTNKARLATRKRRGPMREIAFARRVDAIKLPKYRYATRAFVKSVSESKIPNALITALELSLLFDRLGYRNAVAEYCGEQFAKTGKIPLEGECTYDAISKWADPQLRVTVIEPKRQKKSRERTKEEQKARDKGNAYTRRVQGILAEGQRRGKIEVELRKLLKKVRAKREG